jgi:diacylglycerol kinase (ATP)
MKIPKRIGIIINPASGNDDWKKAERLIKETFPFDSRKLKIIKGKEVYDFSCHLLDWASLIILVGGDGSLNSLAQAIFDKRENLKILFVPTGTANDMAYNLKLPEIMENNLFLAFESKAKNVDLGVVKTRNNTQVFVNSFGLVASVEIIKKFKQLKEKYPKPLAYLFTALSIFKNGFSDPKITIEMEFEKSLHQQTRKRTSVCLLGNGVRSGKFFKVTPEADLSDGFLDFCFMSKMLRVSMPEYLLGYMTGIHKFKKRVLTFDDHLPQIKGLKVELEKPKEYQIDGDVMAPEKKFSVNILEQRLKFLVPEEELN